jgi:uncharacterized protein
MNLIKYFLVGLVFGIVLTKSEAVSWYRIYEMFQFQSFHMFGIIATAICTGVVGIQIIKRKKIKDITGQPIEILDKESGTKRYIFGGVFFGLGWGLVGSCPGPIFILLGAGYLNILWVLLGALLGTLFYGVIQKKLPH